MTRLYLSRRVFVATSLGAGLVAAGCTTTTSADSARTSPQQSQAKRTEIDNGVNAALDQLYR
jgi:hypothetical protein